jgi:hypothetical protein
MRTTVILDADVVIAIEQLRKERGVGLSEAVNQLARAGLRQRPRRPPFRQRTARIGVNIDVSNVAEALEQLDGPSAR